MGRRVGCVVLVLGGLLAAGVFVTWVGRHRAAQDRLYCANNLRELAAFAAVHSQPTKDPRAGPPPTEVPAGTVFNPALPPDRRLSWVVDALPNLDQRRQSTRDLSAGVDRALAWDAPKHQALARAPVDALLCFGSRPAVPFDSPAVTQYVGLGGVGPDAAALPLGNPPAPGLPPAVPPRAGCFRYDTPTPFAAIADGLSTTLLFGELAADPGPWLQGGPATVRTLDVGAGARPAVGPGGQFGGAHPGGANWAVADGSVRFLTDRADRTVLEGMFTANGGATDPLVGE